MICTGHICPKCKAEYSHITTEFRPCWDLRRLADGFKHLRICEDCKRLDAEKSGGEQLRLF